MKSSKKSFFNHAFRKSKTWTVETIPLNTATEETVTITNDDKGSSEETTSEAPSTPKSDELPEESTDVKPVEPRKYETYQLDEGILKFIHGYVNLNLN